MASQNLRNIRAAKTEEEVIELVESNGIDWASAVGIQAKSKIESLRHAQTLPPLWYKHPATWIAIAAVIISLLSWLFPRVAH